MDDINLSALSFPAERVSEVFILLSENNIQAWLDGGWAVDALRNEQTRAHQDLDLLVPIEERERIHEIFSKLGYVNYAQETELPFRMVMFNASLGLLIDFHLVMMQKNGSAVFRITNYKEGVPSYDYVYSANGLRGNGIIAGREVLCITLEEQLRCRTTRKYSFDDLDRQREGGINADLHDLKVIEDLKKEKGLK
jgi:lincosamide nucleotidyltransferase A/C/D/E